MTDEMTFEIPSAIFSKKLFYKRRNYMVNNSKSNKKCKVIMHSEKDRHSAKVYDKISNYSQSQNIGDIKNIYNVDLSECNCILVSASGASVSSSGLGAGIVWRCADCHHSYNPLVIRAENRRRCPVCGSETITETPTSSLVHWLNVLQTHKPDLMVFENVVGLLSNKHKDNFNLIVEEIKSYGYNVYHSIMNASNYGIPLNCERVVMVCILSSKDNGRFRFPKPTRNTPPINNYLDDCSHKFNRTNATVAIDEKIWEYILPAIIRDIEKIITTNKPIFNMKCETGFSDHKIGITKVPTLRASNPSTIVLQTLDTDCGRKYYIKRLSAKECFKLMGFSESDFRSAWSVCSLPQIYKQAANAIPVNMIYKVFEALYLAMPYLFNDLKVASLYSGIGSMEKALDRLYRVINLTEKIEKENSTDTVEIVIDNTMFLLAQLLKNRNNRVR